MSDELIANAEPWTTDQWAAEWRKSEDSRNAMFAELKKTKGERDSAYESILRWQNESAEAIRQVEASDKLYRQMCKERDELKADVKALHDAARCIRHWHDTEPDGMIVSRKRVFLLWGSLKEFEAKYPEYKAT